MEFSPNSSPADKTDEFLADMKRHHEEIRKDYPTPESVVDVYRQGMVTQGFLELAFSPEEIKIIQSESEKRNQAENASTLK